MGFLTKLLRREAEVVLEERYGRAVLAFRCGGAVTYGELVPRWPELAPLAPFVTDPDRLGNAIPEERLPDLLAALAALDDVPRLGVRVADRLVAPKAPADAPAAPEAQEPGPGEDEAPAPAAPAGELAALKAAIAAGEYPDAGYGCLLALFGELARGDGPENLERMLELWRRYIGRVPELAGTPARWIWDYTQVRDAGIAPEELLARLPGLPDPVVDAALTALERSGAPLRLPMWVFSRLSGCDPEASRFYAAFPDRPALDALFTGAVAAVDEALRTGEGKGLLSARCIARTRTQEVEAFRGLGDADAPRYTLRLRLFHRNPRFETYLKLLLRYIEKGLRARYRYNGRLQGDAPDEASRAAVDAFLAQLPPVAKKGKATPPEAPAPRREIALDMESVARLRADSDAARAALLAAVARDAWPEAEGEDEEPPAAGARDSEPAGEAPREAAIPEGVPSPWREFLALADMEALRALLEGPEALRALADARREMPDRLMDALNEAAADALGDVIAGSDGMYDEYREELEPYLR